MNLIRLQRELNELSHIYIEMLDALRQTVPELEFSIAIVNQHHPQRARRMSVFLTTVRQTIARASSP